MGLYRLPSRRRRRRRTAAALLGVACLVAVGYALSLSEDEPDEKPVTLDLARLAAIDRLSSRQYAAIKRVYEAGEEVGRSDNEGLSADIVFRPIVDACEALGDSDPLLAPRRPACVESVKFAIALTEAVPCGGADDCSDLYDEARTSLQRSVRASRGSDRAVDATRLPRSCKRVLTEARKSYREAARLDEALGALQGATRSESTDDDAIAGRRLARAFLSSVNAPSVNEIARLQRGCR